MPSPRWMIEVFNKKGELLNYGLCVTLGPLTSEDAKEFANSEPDTKKWTRIEVYSDISRWYKDSYEFTVNR